MIDGKFLIEKLILYKGDYFINIDNKNVSVPNEITILEAAKIAGIDIPTLCYLKDINEIGACRVCVVEIEGKKFYCEPMGFKEL